MLIKERKPQTLLIMLTQQTKIFTITACNNYTFVSEILTFAKIDLVNQVDHSLVLGFDLNGLCTFSWRCMSNYYKVHTMALIQSGIINMNFRNGRY